MTTMTHNAKAATYHNAAHDIIVKFLGQEFVILGNADKVSDAALMAMYKGQTPQGWEKQGQ